MGSVSQSVTMAVEQSCDGCSQCESNPEYHQRRARNQRAVRKHRTQKQKMENQELERSIRSKGSELELLAKIFRRYMETTPKLGEKNGVMELLKQIEEVNLRAN